MGNLVFKRNGRITLVNRQVGRIKKHEAAGLFTLVIGPKHAERTNGVFNKLSEAKAAAREALDG